MHIIIICLFMVLSRDLLLPLLSRKSLFEAYFSQKIGSLYIVNPEHIHIYLSPNLCRKISLKLMVFATISDQ